MPNTVQCWWQRGVAFLASWEGMDRMKGFGCMRRFSRSQELGCVTNAAVADPVLLAETRVDRS